MEADDQHNYHINLTRPCPMCGEVLGYLVNRNGQLTTWCNGCDKYQYNTPHAELGLRKVKPEKRREIKPSKRARVLKRWQHRCCSCGASAQDVELHIGHLVPISEKKHIAASKAELLDHEFNLAPMCADCNLGYSDHPVALSLMLFVLEMYVREAPK